MDTRLLDILVCPVCKANLEYRKADSELVCKPCKLAYPVRDDIPLMLVDLARDMTLPADATPSPSHAATAEPAA